MDTEDREHFKTIGLASARPPIVSSPPKSSSPPDLGWYLTKAKIISGSYRRDEAHDPEMFAASLAAVLADYPVAIVEYVSDPRTGIVDRFPNGLPNVGQIKEFCESVYVRQQRIEHYAALPPPKKFEPPPIKPGQIGWEEFERRVAAGELKQRVMSVFEWEKNGGNNGL